MNGGSWSEYLEYLAESKSCIPPSIYRTDHLAILQFGRLPAWWFVVVAGGVLLLDQSDLIECRKVKSCFTVKYDVVDLSGRRAETHAMQHTLDSSIFAI